MGLNPEVSKRILKKIEKSPKAIISADALMRILKKSVVNLAVLAISLCHHVVSQLA
jgi:hypothetical protein